MVVLHKIKWTLKPLVRDASGAFLCLNGYQVRRKVYTLNQKQKDILNQAVKEISNRINALQLA